MTGAGSPPSGARTDVSGAPGEGRAEAFGYVCNRCSRCCYDKVIQVNPYEIARLARGLGTSTSAFRRAWTEAGAGAHLTRRDDGACSFLGPEGCTVHPDRPLVCRIYPLGRHVGSDGAERWSHLAPHPQSEGIYSRRGAIADYLAAQDALPFMQATDEYTAWIRRAWRLLEAGGEALEPAQAPSDLLDMDGMIAEHCQEEGSPEPIDIEARKDLHLKILTDRLDQLAGREPS